MVANKKFLAILQVIFFIAMIAVNALANILPINGYNTAEVSNMYPNLFVPAGFTFSIWGVIYLLLLVWVIYSTILLWKNNGQHPAYQHVLSIAPLFIVTCILNLSWILIWHHLYPATALVVMGFFLLALVAIYIRMQQHSDKISGLQKWVLYVPFVIYLAWICVASIANTAAVLVHAEWAGFGIAPWIWSCIMIVVATILAVWFGYVKKEFGFALVIAWALFGIYKGQSATSKVSTTAIFCCGFSLLAGIIGAMKRSS